MLVFNRNSTSYLNIPEEIKIEFLNNIDKYFVSKSNDIYEFKIEKYTIRYSSNEILEIQNKPTAEVIIDPNEINLLIRVLKEKNSIFSTKEFKENINSYLYKRTNTVSTVRNYVIYYQQQAYLFHNKFTKKINTKCIKCINKSICKGK